jgi:Suppressor of fused protein (SUFU)
VLVSCDQRTWIKASQVPGVRFAAAVVLKPSPKAEDLQEPVAVVSDAPIDVEVQSDDRRLVESQETEVAAQYEPLIKPREVAEEAGVAVEEVEAKVEEVAEQEVQLEVVCEPTVDCEHAQDNEAGSCDQIVIAENEAELPIASSISFEDDDHIEPTVAVQIETTIVDSELIVEQSASVCETTAERIDEQPETAVAALCEPLIIRSEVAEEVDVAAAEESAAATEEVQVQVEVVCEASETQISPTDDVDGILIAGEQDNDAGSCDQILIVENEAELPIASSISLEDNYQVEPTVAVQTETTVVDSELIVEQSASAGETTTEVINEHPKTTNTQAVDVSAKLALLAEWAKQREAAYVQHFGPFSSIQRDKQDSPLPVDIYIHPPNEFRPVTTLVTSGMSNHAMPVPAGPNSPRIELILYVNGMQSAYVQLLRFLAQAPFRQHSWLAYGSMMNNGNPPRPIFKDSVLDSYMFMIPNVSSDFLIHRSLRLADAPVQLLWVQPITQAERRVISTVGIRHFCWLMDQHQHPLVIDPSRICYATQSSHVPSGFAQTTNPSPVSS